MAGPGDGEVAGAELDTAKPPVTRQARSLLDAAEAVIGARPVVMLLLAFLLGLVLGRMAIGA
jgi:hypothetical protein